VGNLYAHPELLDLERSEGGDLLTVVSGECSDGDLSRLRSMAVFRAIERSVYLIPGLPVRRTLRVGKLVGNRVLGSNSSESLASCLEEFGRMLTSGEVDQVFFEDIEVGSPLRTAIEGMRLPGVQAVSPSAPQPHWWIRFPEPAEDYWKKFSSKTRYNLRSSAKKLLHTVTCYKEDPSLFLEKAHRVSVESWQSKKLGLRIKNNPAERRYWERVASLGALRGYILEQGEQPLAFILGVQWGGCFVLEEIGYNSAHAKSSPGNVLHFRMLEDLISCDTPAVLDFGYGDNEYKRLFGNHQSMSGPVILARRASYPLAAARFERMRREMGRMVREQARRMGILPALRRLARR
jgi:hypothetical protein